MFLCRETASSQPSSVVQNLLQSLGGGQAQAQAQDHDKPFTTLQDLLTPTSTIPFIEFADEKTVDNLLSYLPPTLLLAAVNPDMSATEANPELVEALMQSLDIPQKKSILARVLRSPQFTQSLASLTLALRDGGLPSISEALKIPVENGGFMRRGGVPVGGGVAVESFLEGARQQARKGTGQEDRMETE